MRFWHRFPVFKLHPVFQFCSLTSVSQNESPEFSVKSVCRAKLETQMSRPEGKSRKLKCDILQLEKESVRIPGFL